jgi:hypothetical protein
MSEEWHKTHAVLLKSVAEAQGKLLAGINALESKLDNLHGIAEHNAMEQSAKLDGIRDGLVDEIRIVRDSVVCAIGHAFVNFERKVSGAKAPRSTKRKPRGRRK